MDEDEDEDEDEDYPVVRMRLVWYVLLLPCRPELARQTHQDSPAE
jgi:hypothetical protein